MAACYGGGHGREPDDKQLYFPTGIAVSRSGNFLFVVNSDFDLRYNAGTLQALDLKALAAVADDCRKVLQHECPDVKPEPPDEKAKACPRSLSECTSTLGVSDFVRANVRLGAFASDVVVTTPRIVDGQDTYDAPVDQGRLLVPVRGDATLSIIDYFEGLDAEGNDSIRLRCSPSSVLGDKGHACDPSWTKGNESNDNTRQIVLPGEPYSVAISEQWSSDPNDDVRRVGGVATVVHQASGNVSAFVGVSAVPASPRFEDNANPPDAKLAYSLSGLAVNGTGIAALDVPARPGEGLVSRFLVTTRSQPVLQLVQFSRDPIADRSGLVLNGNIPYPTQFSGSDSRNVVVDPPSAHPSDPTKSEQRPTRVFVTSRSPNSLIVGAVDPSTGIPRFYTNVPLPIGASRLTRAVVDEGRGPRTKILVSSFDAQRVVIFDPELGIISNVVSTKKGPSSIAAPRAAVVGNDQAGSGPPYPYAIVANFTESTLQFIDLNPASRGTATYEQIVLTVGASAPKQ